MLTYDQAFQKTISALTLSEPVVVPLLEALGKVLAESVRAARDLPATDKSTMDGYAFFTWDRCAPGCSLEVVGFLGAGGVFEQSVRKGEAVRIMTGAPIPPGCNTVVPVECVTREGSRVTITEPVSRGAFILKRGSEIGYEEELLPHGTPVHSRELALLAANGTGRVAVFPTPRVAILSTGDELVELEDSPRPEQIIDSNSHFLVARLKEKGFEVSRLGIARDDPKDLEAKLTQGLEADVLVISGGVSVGDCDYVKATLKKVGFQQHFWRAAIKPGKPVLFGKIGPKTVFGLPGNPGATAATCELFVLPALRYLSGHRQLQSPRINATLRHILKSECDRQRFIWGSLEASDGRLEFVSSDFQESGYSRSFYGARALLPVAPGKTDMEAGEDVEVILLDLPTGSALNAGQFYQDNQIMNQRKQAV